MVEEPYKVLSANDFYKFRTDRYNLFIYRPVVSKVEQRTNLKRTCVHAMPRASLCTITSMCGAFALLGVRARKPRGLIWLSCFSFFRKIFFLHAEKFYYSPILINIFWSNFFCFFNRLFVARNHTLIMGVICLRHLMWWQTLIVHTWTNDHT